MTTIQLRTLRSSTLLLTVIIAVVAVCFARHVTAEVSPNVTSANKIAPVSMGKYLSPAPRRSDYDESAQELLVPFYNVSGDWTSRLVLNNQAPKHMYAAVTLFSMSGTPLRLPTITLEAHGSKTFELNQWTTDPAFRQGSVYVSYYGPERVMSGAVRIINAKKSLIFDEQLTTPDEYYFKSSRLEGVWWGRSRQTEMDVALTNTTNAGLVADLIFHSPQGNTLGFKSVSLGAHETRIVDAEDVIGKGNEGLPARGGISIRHTGNPGAVFASALLQEPDSGFSSTVELEDPEAYVASRFDGTGLRLGSVAGQRLNNVLNARNVGSSDVVLSTRIVYTRRDGTDAVIAAPELKLRAGETSAVAIDKAIRKIGVEEAAVAGIEIEYDGAPGSVVVSALSVTDNGNQVFRVPLIDAAGKAHPTNSGKYHLEIAPGLSSVVYLKNVTAEPQFMTMVIEYPGAIYSAAPRMLEPNRTIVVDLKQLRDNRVPDEDGRLLPADLVKGYLSWSAHSTKNMVKGEMEKPENHVMIGRYENADLSSGLSSTASYGCMCQPSYADAWIEKKVGSTWSVAGGGNMYIDDTMELRAREMDSDCGGWDTHTVTSATIGSQNDPVATVNYSTNVLTAVDGGDATIQAYWTAPLWIPLYECCDFDTYDPTPSFQVHVKKPNSLEVLSVTLLPDGSTSSTDGCPDSNATGVKVSVNYQVNDQDGSAYAKNTMEPQEKITNTSFNGTSQGDPVSSWTDIGPSRITGTSQMTDSNGRFLDAPYGFCWNTTFTSYVFTQQVSVLIGSKRFNVRTHTVTVTGTSTGHGSIANGSDISKNRP